MKSLVLCDFGYHVVVSDQNTSKVYSPSEVNNIRDTGIILAWVEDCCVFQGWLKLCWPP